MSKWISEIRNELADMKAKTRLRGLADYIHYSFPSGDVDQIVKHLQDKTKQVSVEIIVTDREPLTLLDESGSET